MGGGIAATIWEALKGPSDEPLWIKVALAIGVLALFVWGILGIWVGSGAPGWEYLPPPLRWIFLGIGLSFLIIVGLTGLAHAWMRWRGGTRRRKDGPR